ncbi:MAG: alpha/beta hydrolase [Rubrivivax sp.]
MAPKTQHDDAWYEAQYNNRARVPGFAAIVEGWRTRSQQARDTQPCVLDVPYGSGPGQTLDIFPAARAGAPVLVFIHGGYWRSLDKADHSFVAPAFAQAGVTVVVPNYALCPAVSVADITMQMVQAVAWTARHIHAHHGDARRIVVAGHSAGGHLAAMMLACRWRDVDARLPAALVPRALSISGLFDLRPLRRAASLQADLRLTPAQARQVSPACLPAPRGRRLVAVVGALESEEFIRQNGLLTPAWGRRAVPVCEAIPQRHHFDILHDLAEPGTRLHGLARELLGLPPA